MLLTSIPEISFLIKHHPRSDGSPLLTARVFLLFQILNAITGEILEHEGSFRTPMDQIDFIVKALKKGTVSYESMEE